MEIETVRQLRKKNTPAEQKFWQIVRNRKFLGKKFLRQYPIEFVSGGKPRRFIADFYCHEARLVIELDGGVHKRQDDYDQLRELILYDLGFRVVRFKK